jgi:folate-binding protein YgfZ
VSGADRVRWLDGMLTRDVTRLAAGGRTGCRALALTRKGQIVADLRVWPRQGGFWLETERAALPGLLEHLRKHVAADDVELSDAAPELALLAVEGPAAHEVLARATGGAELPAEGEVAAAAVAGIALALAGWGESGEMAFRIAAPTSAAARVEEALFAAGAPLGLVRASAAAHEILRIEAGVPGFAGELALGLLPAEARLTAAIAFDKGCYTGQEIVARVESRAQIRRILVGLRLEGEPAPTRGAAIRAAEERVGEITSSARSPALGTIAIGLVRVPHDAAGTALHVEALPARVVPLPFVAPAARNA